MDDRSLRAHAGEIFRAGLEAADAGAAVARSVVFEGRTMRVGGEPLSLEGVERIRVVGMGKASAAMAEPLEALLGDRIESGLLIVKDGHTRPLGRIRTLEAGHPIPDDRGLGGAEEILGLLADGKDSDLVFCLISGGGSALAPAPAAGITLQDKQKVTSLLLSSGATIHELNTVRKHLSRIKGGRLAQSAWPATLVSLILSDVVGDDLDTIASGPTVPDRGTFRDCLEILERRGIGGGTVPAVLSHLVAGADGEVPETPGVDDPAFSRTRNLIVGNNRMALEAAERRARALGYTTLLPTGLEEGEARELAREHVDVVRRIRAGRTSRSRPTCILTGGEATVTLRGKGKGGRNQEFALAAALALDGEEGVVVLSGGTDGTDGPTDAAGALADGNTAGRARSAGLDPAAHLSAHDSYHFFQPLGDLLMTGPTFTNVMDLRVVLVG